MKIIATFVMNVDPNLDPFDPVQVSDPRCWINGAAAKLLKRGMFEKISMIRHALNTPAMPITQAGELDISDQVELDEVSGDFRLKDAATIGVVWTEYNSGIQVHQLSTQKERLNQQSRD